MKLKRFFKITMWVVVICFGIALLLIGYFYYLSNIKYKPSNNVFTKRVAYIDINSAQYSKNFKVCDSTYILDYYNYAEGDSISKTTSYIHGKNGLRKHVLSQYINNNYQDSGYLNFRFIVNCQGRAGAYIIHENDLNLKPTKFNKELVNQLFKITRSLKEWHPNYIRGAYRDSYIYISYRIEHGEITEIIP